MADIEKCYCRHCDAELEWSHKGSCPFCNKTGKKIVVEHTETIKIKENIRVVHQGERKKTDRKILLLMLSGMFGTGIIGYFIGGVIGLAFGIIVGGLSLAFSDKAIWKEKFKNTFESK